MSSNPLLLLADDEYALRLGRIRDVMKESSIEALLISDYANLFYLTGRVYTGYAFIPVEGMPLFFVRRPWS